MRFRNQSRRMACTTGSKNSIGGGQQVAGKKAPHQPTFTIRAGPGP